MMGTDKDYRLMSDEDLMQELDRLAEELADLEQEREYLLRRTNVHVSDSRTRSAETAIDSVREATLKIREILKKRGFGEKILTRDPGKRP